MRVLVTGADGQLGYDVLNELRRRKIDSIGVNRKTFDIIDFEKATQYITQYHPDAVIHCGAYTAVDRAEIESELCKKVNVEGTQNIANCCKKISAKMIYISSDYVFDGNKIGCYEVDDMVNPQNVYGLSKLGGENAVKNTLERYFIVRTSWAFGINGNNFVKTILNLAKKSNELNVVCDQIGSPTYTYDLAELLCDMVNTEKYGVYHATNSGSCSWAEFAEEILKDAGIPIKINYLTTNQYPTKAKRPKNSCLSKRKLTDKGFNQLRDWHEALFDYIKILEAQR